MRGHRHQPHRGSPGRRGSSRSQPRRPPSEHHLSDPDSHSDPPRPPDRRPEILVDAANVAFTNRDEPGERGSVENILKMRHALVELGFRPILIADASLKYTVDRPDELTRLEQSDQILEAPAGTDADYFLLAYSEREGLPIVSNDTFRDRRGEFPHAVRRRVPFMIVDGEVIVDEERLRQAQQAA